ncbi:MAG: type II secretion system F family protein [Candidatus Pacearchaeota archaeon]
MEASDRFEVARILRQQGYTIISCEEKASQKGDIKKLFSFFSRSVSSTDKVIFSRNLGVMVGAGLSLTRALGVLSKQTQNKRFKKIINELEDFVNKGKMLSEAMKNYPKVFSPLFVAMVRVGEEGGRLSESLKLVADQMEKDNNLIRKIKGAMVYPSVIIVAMILIGILMLVYVVPTLVSTFKELNIELPATTRAIIFFSDFFVNHFIFFITGIIFLFSLSIWIIQTKRGKRIVADILLKIPLFSGITKKVNAARTCRTLSSLISSGVNIIDSLSITQDVLQNYRYKNVLERAKEEVQRGTLMSEIFKSNSNLYPILVGEMMAVGEETGKLSDMLLQLANFYEEEVENATKDLTTVIEPILMVIIGGVVGFFAISMIQPMYSMMGGI